MAKKLSTTAAPTLCYRVRAAMGLSQRGFAEEIGVARKTINNWESGTAPSATALKMLELLAKQYKVK